MAADGRLRRRLSRGLDGHRRGALARVSRLSQPGGPGSCLGRSTRRPGARRRRDLSVHALEGRLPQGLPLAAELHHDPRLWPRQSRGRSGRRLPRRLVPRLLLGADVGPRGRGADEPRLDGGAVARVPAREELALRRRGEPRRGRHCRTAGGRGPGPASAFGPARRCSRMRRGCRGRSSGVPIRWQEWSKRTSTWAPSRSIHPYVFPVWSRPLARLSRTRSRASRTRPRSRSTTASSGSAANAGSALSRSTPARFISTSTTRTGSFTTSTGATEPAPVVKLGPAKSGVTRLPAWRGGQGRYSPPRLAGRVGGGPG